MRIRHAVVETFMGAVFDWRHDMTVRGGIGPSMLEIGLRSGQPCFFNSLFSTCLADLVSGVHRTA